MTMKSMGKRDDVIDADFTAGADVALKRVAEYLERLSNEVGDVDIFLKYWGRDQTNIDSWVFRPGGGDDHAALAEEIVDAARSTGDQKFMSGSVRFKVVTKQFANHCGFKLEFSGEEGDMLEEGPSEKGISMQQMRHTERMTGRLVDLVDTIVRDWREERHEMRGRMRDMEDHQFRIIPELSRLYDMRVVHEMELRREQRGEHRKDELTGFLMTSAQTMANKIMGAKMFDKSVSPVEQLMYAFFSTLDRDTVMKLGSTGNLQMNQNQMLGFFELLKTMQEMAQKFTGNPPPAPSPEEVQSQPKEGGQ